MARAAAAGAAATIALAGCAGSNRPSTVTADGFRASFGAHAERSSSLQHVGGRSVTVTTWVAARGAETDAVATFSVPAGAASSTEGGRAAAAVAGSVDRLGGTVLYRRQLRWLGHGAEDAVIATTDRLVRERVLAVGRRLYVLEGISRAAHPRFAGFDRLLSSFRLAAGGGSRS